MKINGKKKEKKKFEGQLKRPVTTQKKAEWEGHSAQSRGPHEREPECCKRLWEAGLNRETGLHLGLEKTSYAGFKTFKERNF